MAIGCPVENLIEKLGHDGSCIQWPDLPEPMRRRSWHIQEIITTLYLAGWKITAIERCPAMAPKQSSPIDGIWIDNKFAFDFAIQRGRGVLTGKTSRCGHAVAYDHGQICDPRGQIYRYDGMEAITDFRANCAWIVTK
jgi:hypothetical protein